MFSEKEIAYLKSQRLARIATASKESQPDVAPVGFDFDGTYFYVGGRNLGTTLKYRNIQNNPKVFGGHWRPGEHKRVAATGHQGSWDR